MMKHSKFFKVGLIILLAFSVVAFSATAVKIAKIKVGQTRDVAFGRMGVHFTKSQYAGTVVVSQRSDDPAEKGSRLLTPQKLLDVRFLNKDGTRQTHIQGAIYVFYKLRRSEMKLYDAGALAIFYFDPWHNEWTECNTFPVIGSEDRVGCRILNFGLYGLGVK
jgi:hypothetical protein